MHVVSYVQTSAVCLWIESSCRSSDEIATVDAFDYTFLWQ